MAAHDAVSIQLQSFFLLAITQVLYQAITIFAADKYVYPAYNGKRHKKQPAFIRFIPPRHNTALYALALKVANRFRSQTWETK